MLVVFSIIGACDELTSRDTRRALPHALKR